MTNQERFQAIMHFKPYDRLPLAHFGYWTETFERWAAEGHLTAPEKAQFEKLGYVADGGALETSVSDRLGFDFNYYTTVSGNYGLMPAFESKLIGTTADGFEKRLNRNGVVELHRGDAGSIPAEIDHLLKDRESWERDFKHRMQWSPERVNFEHIDAWFAMQEGRGVPLGLHCGSLFGQLRDIMGVEGISYLYADDDELYEELINTNAEVCYQQAKAILEHGYKFDFAHFWEDICFKNGPLVVPRLFAEYVGPHYKRITDLLRQYGVDIVSLDCDGCIDSLVPIWLENGVNTMFPIEVGTWNASIAPWREAYGKAIHGVGGMNKTVFARDYAAIDAEIERLKPLVALGGYLPCMDHRIPPDAKWENVQYYCEKMHSVFG